MEAKEGSQNINVWVRTLVEIRSIDVETAAEMRDGKGRNRYVARWLLVVGVNIAYSARTRILKSLACA